MFCFKLTSHSCSPVTDKYFKLWKQFNDVRSSAGEKKNPSAIPASLFLYRMHIVCRLLSRCAQTHARMCAHSLSHTYIIKWHAHIHTHTTTCVRKCYSCFGRTSAVHLVISLLLFQLLFCGLSHDNFNPVSAALLLSISWSFYSSFGCTSALYLLINLLLFQLHFCCPPRDNFTSVSSALLLSVSW